MEGLSHGAELHVIAVSGLQSSDLNTLVVRTMSVVDVSSYIILCKEIKTLATINTQACHKAHNNKVPRWLCEKESLPQQTQMKELTNQTA